MNKPIDPRTTHRRIPIAEWQRNALKHQTTVITDAFADTLVRRYQLERFGHESGAYAADRGNWDADFAFTQSVGRAFQPAFVPLNEKRVGTP